jgi:hypothetical protein
MPFSPEASLAEDVEVTGCRSKPMVASRKYFLSRERKQSVKSSVQPIFYQRIIQMLALLLRVMIRIYRNFFREPANKNGFASHVRDMLYDLRKGILNYRKANSYLKVYGTWYTW